MNTNSITMNTNSTNTNRRQGIAMLLGGGVGGLAIGLAIGFGIGNFVGSPFGAPCDSPVSPDTCHEISLGSGGVRCVHSNRDLEDLYLEPCGR